MSASPPQFDLAIEREDWLRSENVRLRQQIERRNDAFVECVHLFKKERALLVKEASNARLENTYLQNKVSELVEEVQKFKKLFEGSDLAQELKRVRSANGELSNRLAHHRKYKRVFEKAKVMAEQLQNHGGVDQSVRELARGIMGIILSAPEIADD